MGTLSEIHSQKSDLSWSRAAGSFVLVATLGVWLIVNLTAVWVAAQQKTTPVLVSIGPTEVGLVMAALGAKVWQKKFEK